MNINSDKQRLTSLYCMPAINVARNACRQCVAVFCGVCRNKQHRSNHSPTTPFPVGASFSNLCINLSIHFYAVLSEALGGVEAGRSIVLQNSTKKSFKQQQSCQLPLAQIHVRHVPTAPVERDGSLNTCKRIRHAISY